MNPLYKELNTQPGNNLLQRFQQFRQQFRGDPRQQVQNLLNSGKVSQDQYNNAVRMAQQFQKMFGIK